MGRSFIYNQRKINRRNYFLQTKECEHFSKWKNSASNKCPTFERSPFVGLANSSNFQFNTVRSKQKPKEYCENGAYSQVYSFAMNGPSTSIVDTENDLRSSENIFTDWKYIQCRMINLSKKLQSRIFQDKLLEKVNILLFIICLLHWHHPYALFLNLEDWKLEPNWFPENHRTWLQNKQNFIIFGYG